MGGVRRGEVPGGRLLLLPRPPKPWVHDPVGLAWLTVTAVATMVPLLEEPVAVTQSPTATDGGGNLKGLAEPGRSGPADGDLPLLLVLDLH